MMQLQEYETEMEKVKAQSIQMQNEEKRKNMIEETKQQKSRAEYQDVLARKRYEDQLAQQVSFASSG